MTTATEITVTADCQDRCNWSQECLCDYSGTEPSVCSDAGFSEDENSCACYSCWSTSADRDFD